MTAIRPPRIERGQTLGIVAPAGPVNAQRCRDGLARLGDVFPLKIADSVLGPHAEGLPGYLAATDDVRAAEFNAMLRDRDVRAILLARGGYGIQRILPKLDVAALRADPKPIIGFSDATALLAWAWHAGVRGIHGPMGVQLASLPASDIAQLITLMTEAHAPGIRPWTLAAHGRGRHRGPLVAGNLTMFSLTAGTPWPLPLAGAIALIEEVGEKPYEIDRYLTQLSLTGELAKIRAAIIGDFTRCFDQAPPSGRSDPDDAAITTVLERLHSAGTPVAVGAPVGHGDRNEALPFGADSVLDLDACTLEILEPAVA
ncbi:MAG: LD-carboxypeptidase [Deltaproteobacteria bacterium]|nr:LD-carboxypeptidase [Deltaproteobacteria bacterium]